MFITLSVKRDEIADKLSKLNFNFYISPAFKTLVEVTPSEFCKRCSVPRKLN